MEKEEAHRKRGARYFIPALLYSASELPARVQSITEISVLLPVSELEYGRSDRSARRGVYFAISPALFPPEPYIYSRALYISRVPAFPFFHIFPLVA